MCCGLKTHKQVASSQLAGSEQAVNKQLASSKKIFQLEQQTNRQIKTFGRSIELLSYTQLINSLVISQDFSVFLLTFQQVHTLKCVIVHKSVKP